MDFQIYFLRNTIKEKKEFIAYIYNILTGTWPPAKSVSTIGESTLVKSMVYCCIQRPSSKSQF